MLEAIELTKSYGTFQALKGLNLKIEKGEVFCLLGQNGAGKTTTINIFLALPGISYSTRQHLLLRFDGLLPGLHRSNPPDWKHPLYR